MLNYKNFYRLLTSFDERQGNEIFTSKHRIRKTQFASKSREFMFFLT